MQNHRITREGDEYVCTCGLRWDIDEDDPHHKTSQEHVDSLRYQLDKGKRDDKDQK